MFRLAIGKLWIVGVVLAAAGCSSTIRYPKLRGPGPAKYQRANAEAFDPYPLPDLGPPIDGGRPREFAIPRNEVERAQDYSIVQAARRGLPTVPLAGAAVGTPIPVGPPTPLATGGAAPPFVPTTPPVTTIPTTPAPIYAPPPSAAPTFPSGAPYGEPSIRY
jgi:hypothetical protein